ncbi:hypothetical protein CN884_17510 [Ochrobactrum sp. 30A/1000/2015]|nr:hypothetical protein [Ochrobactrum sp. RH1CCR137]MBA8856806.1 hypothetical protein [Ochrobactrum sp. RH1CCR134]OAB84886.1 hypothetical protein A4G21_14625 [Brucella intermedia]PJT20749.1 hypothetical protein CN884_17510 [Ochrobactrum sp. 30A/1000/2015]PJT36697.1 hypothetical protein CN883_21925 [Ochrobactrum sp. 27A/999/2015]PJT43509.1 hypothetical protein CN882_11340 [Ochrobactrum sp. 23A/997/2015]
MRKGHLKGVQRIPGQIERPVTGTAPARALMKLFNTVTGRTGRVPPIHVRAKRGALNIAFGISVRGITCKITDQHALQRRVAVE